MIKHILSLEVPVSANTEVLEIRDTSSWAENVIPVCPMLRITLPGFITPVDLEIVPGFVSHYDACGLGVQVNDCGTIRNSLPDGIYTIRLTSTPYDKLWVEYKHLRTTSILERWHQVLADVGLSDCEPSNEVKEKLKELRLIESYIKAAKAEVEYRGCLEAGMDLLAYAKRRLDKFCDVSCC